MKRAKNVTSSFFTMKFASNFDNYNREYFFKNESMAIRIVTNLISRNG